MKRIGNETVGVWPAGKSSSAEAPVAEDRVGKGIMTYYNFFYYTYASFTKTQLPLLKVAALYFYKLVLLDPVGASWAAFLQTWLKHKIKRNVAR